MSVMGSCESVYQCNVVVQMTFGDIIVKDKNAEESHNPLLGLKKVGNLKKNAFNEAALFDVFKHNKQNARRQLRKNFM